MKHLILWLLSPLWLCIYCQPNPNPMKKEKFSYRVSVTAPREYPAEVYIGYLADEKDFITSVPSGMTENQGWTANGSDPGFGGNRIPTELEITWLSFAEKKFWKLQTTLPKDVILQKFQEGFQSFVNAKSRDLKEDTYDSFVIGLAPGGVVVVWLTGRMHRVEIGRYQAQETSVSNNKFRPVPDPDETQDEFFQKQYDVTFTPEMQDSLKKNGIPYGLWDQYRKKYHWRFTTELYNAQDKDRLQYHTYYNGEQTVLYEPKVQEHSYLFEAPPYRASLYFNDSAVDVEFDWKEISSAFELLSKDNPEAKIDIIAKPEFMYAGTDYWITNGKKEIPLKKVISKNWKFKKN